MTSTITPKTSTLASRLTNRFKKRVFRRVDREDGNSIVIWVMLAPVIFGAFGTSTDLAVGSYINSALQTGLDTATQTTLSYASNRGASTGFVAAPRLEVAEAKSEYRRVYDFNRRANAGANEAPTLICQATRTSGITGTLQHGGSGCSWTEEQFNYVRRSGGSMSLRVEVYEKSNPMFIQILGFDHINYHLSSSARIDTAYELD